MMTLKQCVSALVMLVLAGTCLGAGDFLAVDDAAAKRLGVLVAGAGKTDDAAALMVPGVLVVPPAQQAALVTPVAGTVQRLLVATGAEVTAGQAMATLQSPDFLALQRSFLDAVAQAALAQAQLVRDEQLLADGIIAQRRLDETRAAAGLAAAVLAEQRQLLKLCGLRDDELARLTQTHQLLSSLELRAPRPGSVIALHAGIGSQLGALSPVFDVADLSGLWLEMQVPQGRATTLKAGHKASVQAQGQEVRGTITHIDKVTQPGTQTVLVRATLAQVPAALRAGQLVDARISVDAAGAVVVPSAAIFRHQGKVQVFVQSNGGFSIRTVEVLSQDAGQALVSQGLAAGDRVVIQGVAALKALWLSQEEGAR